MNPEYSLQDVVNCQLCDKSNSLLHCDICQIGLCKQCVGTHIVDGSKMHKVVPYNKRASSPYYPKCYKHSNKQCVLHCEQCDVPLCVQCISSNKHNSHISTDILQWYAGRKEGLDKELQKLEKIIYPKYKDIRSHISFQRAELQKNSLQIKIALNTHKDNWYKEIDAIVKKIKADLDQKDSEQLTLLQSQEEKIKSNIFKITEYISKIKRLLATNDIRLVYEHKQSNAEFNRELPSYPTVPLPEFLSKKIDSQCIGNQFGTLFTLPYKAEQFEPALNSTDVKSSPLDIPLIVKPRVVEKINTKYGVSKEIRSVSAVNDDEIWTSGDNKMLKLYNLKSELVRKIKTKSGNKPSNLQVTKSGDLVYTDYVERTVNIVQNTHISEVVKLKEWIPRFVYCTSSGDLLVFMDNDDDRQSKVVRYSGSMEKQNIQFDESGQPFYSYDSLNDRCKYVSENKNLDICVSDWGAKAVVVVNETGKHRFNYPRKHPTDNEEFDPYGITTDSQSRILIADSFYNRIHIIDQNGQFLCFIASCGLERPVDLCVDTKGNIFVAERFTGRLKKIQYQKQAVLLYQRC